MRRLLAMLFLGALAGAVAMSTYCAGRLERLYWEKEKLQVQLFETSDRLHRLESQWTEHRSGEVSAVEIEIEGETGTFAELELRRLMHEITSDLIGEVVEQLNPKLALSLLHGRRLTVERKTYLVAVKWLIVAEQVTFNVSVSLADE